jgi:hypothetical protein
MPKSPPYQAATSSLSGNKAITTSIRKHRKKQQRTLTKTIIFWGKRTNKSKDKQGQVKLQKMDKKQPI